MARLFIGIRIENHQKLTAFSSCLREKLSGNNINWVDPAGFHLTLKFLGEVESHFINSIRTLLTHISQQHNTFTLEFNKLGFFGSNQQPRVIWFDFLANSKLDLLRRNIDSSLFAMGFDIENKEFRPHLTLARIKNIKDVSEFTKIIQYPFRIEDTIEVKSFQLIESILKHDGPEYITVADFSLIHN
jgi:RNA 2',3'-cyclic 3'-phosphodiesterase